MSGDAAWPALPLDAWEETRATLHLWTQMVGKTRLALSPSVNHWWHVALYLTARGLGTSPMPAGEQTIEVEFDLIDHVLVARRSDGATRELPLAAGPVADFYRGYRDLLASLGVKPRMYPVPVEIPDPIPFPEDRTHTAYDPAAANRFWHALSRAERVLEDFRGEFIGKCSPVHFWWGGFDLACTRFSGRRAPPHPGGVPNTPDFVTREGYSHECISAGWWPGSGTVQEPAFYAYAYPEPEGCAEQPVSPAGAHYDRTLREWILPYEAARTSPDPAGAVRAFLQSTYETAATLGHWDRAALER